MKLFKMFLVCFMILVSQLVIFAEQPEDVGVGQSVVTSKSLVGEWICKSYSRPNVANPAIDEVWELDSENLFSRFLGGTIIFQDDGDGTYSILPSGQSPFYMMTTDAVIESPYKVRNNVLCLKIAFFLAGQDRVAPSIFGIKKITQNKLIFTLIHSSSYSAKLVIAERVLGQ